MSEAEQIARALKGRKSGNGWVCNCPSLTHGSHDRNPSLSVTDGTDGKLLLHCHKGCEFADVMDALRSRGIVETAARSSFGDPVARMNARAARPAPSSYSLEETFDMPEAHVEPLRRGRAWNPLEYERSHIYHDATGNPCRLVAVKRKPDGDKAVVQFGRLADGSWDSDAPKGPMVPYRLPELLAAQGASPVFIVEGEKDVETLEALGHLATTNPNGALNWHKDLNQFFAGLELLIVPDADKPGEERVGKLCDQLKDVASSIKVVRLPDLEFREKHGEDITDWIEKRGHTNDEFIEIARAAPEWTKDVSGGAPPLKPLKFIDMSLWDVTPVPPRQWAVRDRVPAHQVTLFSGEGGSGKSIIELQLACAHVLERDWFGSLPEPGPVIYQGCEDTRDELHRRVASICEHYDVKFADLTKGGLHMLSCVEGDGLLGVPNRSGQIEPTRMYDRLLEAANDIKPKHIGIDTSADVYGGNEIDRGQVRQFVSLLRKLAIAANGSVVLLSHPSLTGINSGTGLSGSTAWHNSVRSRIYLTSDGDMRTIEFKKNQYGPLGERVVVRYEDGVFIPDGGKTDVELALINNLADEAFLTLLDLTAKQLRFFGAQKGTNYAPAQLAKLPQAKGYTAKTLADAMERLLAAEKIKLVPNPTKKASKATLVLLKG